MSLYSERVRAKARAEAEAAGESFWTDQFSGQFRTRFVLMVDRLTDGQGLRSAHAALLAAAGSFHLVDPFNSPYDDVREFVLGCADDWVPNVIEATYGGLVQLRADSNVLPDVPMVYERSLNASLLEHRISFELREGEMIEIGSQVMHHDVVLPALTLLSGRKGFEDAEAGYVEALKEMSGGTAADAITDAGRAVQSALAALGCQGNTIHKQLDSAIGKGLLQAHDRRLVKVLIEAAEWVAANRSERGDAHKETEVDRRDARLAIHVAGALILRLAEQAD